NELLTLLKNGVDFVQTIKQERLIEITLPLDREYMIGGFLSDVDKFDYEFFKYSPIEAKSMDPHIRLAIENAYHCFEDSGYRPSFFKGTNTMVVGSTSVLNYYKHHDEFNTTLITGNDVPFIAAALSRKFGLQGNSVVV